MTSLPNPASDTPVTVGIDPVATPSAPLSVGCSDLGERVGRTDASGTGLPYEGLPPLERKPVTVTAAAWSTRKLSTEAFRRTVSDLLDGSGPIEFIANPGNAGDALINAGAWQLFEEIGVASRVQQRVQRPRGKSAPKVCVYPGGGNLIPRYDDARRALEARLDGDFEALVILPHTIRGHETLLSRMDERVHVFCRDVQSFEHVSTHAARARVYLADDLALSIDLRWLLSARRRMQRQGTVLLSPSCVRRYLKWRRRIAGVRPTDGVLRIMRVDVESSGGEPADPAMDLSAHYGSLFDVRGEPELVSGDFIAVLDRADRVVTDRLHVAIGASLLGKDVLIHDNDYGKNRALFELSMRDRFPRTKFAVAV